jgi:hypothetical protein
LLVVNQVLNSLIVIKLDEVYLNFKKLIMSRSLTGIEEKISKIETDTTEFFQEFQHFYRQYLKLLSYCIEQQLILAAHHICTEIYPDAFLRLTFNQRQRLQDRLRKLGREFEADLFVFLKNQAELLIEPEESGKSEELGESEESGENYSSEMTEAEGSESQPKTVPINTANPDELLHWSRSVEYGVRETLEKISKEANALLRGAAILSNVIPAKVLEMAVEAEENGIGMNRSGHPNILNLLIEATAVSELDNDDENDDDDDDDEMPNPSSITKITAIHLRLAEIEFGDPNLSHARKQLRDFLERLGKLRKQYRQLKREYLTVEAKNAWRSSWSEN